jgi:hypothetical protein
MKKKKETFHQKKEGKCESISQQAIHRRFHSQGDQLYRFKFYLMETSFTRIFQRKGAAVQSVFHDECSYLSRFWRSKTLFVPRPETHLWPLVNFPSQFRSHLSSKKLFSSFIEIHYWEKWPFLPSQDKHTMHICSSFLKKSGFASSKKTQRKFLQQDFFVLSEVRVYVLDLCCF